MPSKLTVLLLFNFNNFYCLPEKKKKKENTRSKGRGFDTNGFPEPSGREAWPSRPAPPLPPSQAAFNITEHSRFTSLPWSVSQACKNQAAWWTGGIKPRCARGTVACSGVRKPLCHPRPGKHLRGAVMSSSGLAALRAPPCSLRARPRSSKATWPLVFGTEARSSPYLPGLALIYFERMELFIAGRRIRQ